MASNAITDDHFMNKIKHRAVKCTICNNTSKDNTDMAQYVCFECRCYLCQSCSDIHYEADDTKNHKLSTLDEAQVVIIDRNEFHQSNYKECHTHMRLLDLFCEDCSEGVCYLCTFDSKHKGHQCISLLSKVKEVKESVAERESGVFASKEKIQKLLDELKSTRQNILSSQDSTIKSMEKHLAKITEDFQHYYEDKKAMLTLTIKSQLDHLDSEIEKSNESLKEIEVIEENISTLLLTPVHQSVQYAKAVQTKIDEVSKKTLLAAPTLPLSTHIIKERPGQLISDTMATLFGTVCNTMDSEPADDVIDKLEQLQIKQREDKARIDELQAELEREKNSRRMQPPIDSMPYLHQHEFAKKEKEREDWRRHIEQRAQQHRLEIARLEKEKEAEKTKRKAEAEKREADMEKARMEECQREREAQQKEREAKEKETTEMKFKEEREREREERQREREERQRERAARQRELEMQEMEKKEVERKQRGTFKKAWDYVW